MQHTQGDCKRNARPQVSSSNADSGSQSAIPRGAHGINSTDKLMWTVGETASGLSVSRAHVYRLFQSGQLRPVRSRGAVRVPLAEVQRYVASLMDGETAAEEEVRHGH